VRRSIIERFGVVNLFCKASNSQTVKLEIGFHELPFVGRLGDAPEEKVSVASSIVREAGSCNHFAVCLHKNTHEIIKLQSNFEKTNTAIKFQSQKNSL
jgi:hypothetical protein